MSPSRELLADMLISLPISSFDSKSLRLEVYWIDTDDIELLNIEGCSPSPVSTNKLY